MFRSIKRLADSILKKRDKNVKFVSKKYSVNCSAAEDVNVKLGTNLSDSLSLEIPGLVPNKLTLNPTWLRHHCLCKDCFNSDTYQRNIIPAKLPPSPSVSNVQLYKSKRHHQENKNRVQITWSDGHISRYDVNWLVKNSPTSLTSTFQRRLPCDDIHRVPWPTFKPFPADPFDLAINYHDLIQQNSNLGLFNLLQSIIDHGFGLVVDSPPDVQGMKNAVSRVSQPMSTIFGENICISSSGLEFADTAYTSEYIYLHTDNTYFSEPSGLEIFHCLEHIGEGGVNSLADGFKIARNLWQERPDFYDILANIPMPFHYIDPGNHFFQHTDVIFSHNNNTGHIEKIRFNPHDIGALSTIPYDDIPIFYQSLIEFSRRMEENPIWIKLNPGTIIFLDNWRMFHGRSEYSGTRSLASAYISRSDWRSKARLLGLL